jgi:UDP-N-acetylglucosamine 2-epimerase
MRFFKNLPIDTYVRLMARTQCLVGNSSSGIREGAFIGTPVVNIGTRQAGRERGHNVVEAPHDADAIRRAIERQIQHGPFPRDRTYGDGLAGSRIAAVLAESTVTIQKRITF